MPRTIDEREYEYLQGRRQVADFVESIYNDPQLAAEAKALIKKKYPNLNIPDYDIEAKVNARLDKEKQDRDDEKERQRRSDEEAEFKKQRATAQKKHGFTDDAMKRLEDMMVERNIGNYEDAAQLMAIREPKPSDATGGDFDSTRWHHEQQNDFSKIAKDPEAWARNELMGAMHRDQDRMRNGG